MDNLFLHNIWYFGLLSKDLPQKKLVGKTLAGIPLVFFRDQQGIVQALYDVCPHRGMPLSCGQYLPEGKGEIECCYHGWQFDGAGACTKIPSLTKDQDFNFSKIKVKTFPCHEQNGTIWVYLGNSSSLQSLPPILEMLSVLKEAKPNLALKMIFPCSVDHAVIGLMDPAHGPFVHKSWFWRTSSSIHEKQKSFVPFPLGFQMARHAPSKNAKAYKILGGTPETEITFSLPGIRFESIKVGRHYVIGLTTITPIDDKTSEITHCIYWTIPWLSLLKPFFYPFAYTFLNQDRRAVALQQKGLAFSPSFLLIKDADTQAKWYFKLKKEYASAQEEKRAFVNPVKPCILKWQS